MSDNEDDWFGKDIDELVAEVKKKVQVQTDSAGQDVDSTSQPHAVKPGFHLNQDFGGSYNISSGARKSKSSTADSRRAKKLIFISEQKPLDVFLEIYHPQSIFFECFEEKVPTDYIRPMIIAMAKFCELPFQEYGRDLLVRFLDSASMLLQIKDFLNEGNATTDIIQKFLNISWTIHYLGLKNEELLHLLDCIKLKYESNFTIKTELQRLLNALGGSVETYKEIYPSLNDLKNDEPVDVKRNIVKGSYSSVEEYIDTHLFLLRQYLMGPLRQLIKELKKFESVEEISSKHVYKEARFLLKDVLKKRIAKGVSLLVDLIPSKRKTKVANKDQSRKSPLVNLKKVKHGTLLCFTSGLEFSDMILAVVTDPEIEILENGYVYVEIVRTYNVNNIFNRNFLMLAPNLFLGPYNYVYGVLRGLDEQNFPMKNFIVNVEQNSDSPDYLKSSTKYYKYGNHRFDPRNLDSYPPCEAMNLDQSQLSAFQSALSRKFSLIHGPPGSGKTFIGLKIVSTLLENTNAKILIVCSTNQALDKFLSGILTNTNDVIRLGNQLKHGSLDRFKVKNPNLNDCFYNTKGEYLKLMEEFERLRKESDEDSCEKVLETQEKLRKASAKLDEFNQIFKFKLIKCKRVVGMTTTYASWNNLLLNLLKIPIVIVVEAAEVLESHMIATLTQSTEHLILIGDHKQHPINITSYKFSKKFNMEISLFERMLSNKVNYVYLNTQHRMRPEFANLLRPTIYEELRDAENVQTYENIRGVAKNMFFVNHDFKEMKCSDETKPNAYEAGFLLALADYLVMQNYQPKDIVILTTYNCQMIEFFNERKKYPRLEKVRITIVDHFQGEESKIILLSLVLNNDANSIGWLQKKNHICIALSRAQEGFFVYGAISFLAKNNTSWRKIQKTLEELKSIGNSLPIICQRHGNMVEVQTVEDFQNVKSGRCCDCS